MTPVRFSECLRSIRWTAIDIVNALQCDLAWIEALEIGEVPVPEDLARWLETIACFHASNPPPPNYGAMAVLSGARGGVDGATSVGV